jgi:hypothetical protein
VTPAEANGLVEEMLEAYDARLLGQKDLSRFYKDNRRIVREGLNLGAVTCVEQVGEVVIEVLAKSYTYICECLEKTFTQGDLAPRSFNYSKWQRISGIEEKLRNIVKKLNTDFRHAEKLETKILQLELTTANKAFSKALEEKQAGLNDIPLPNEDEDEDIL